MIKAIIINFLGIFNSRILGFIRDLLSANILGANIYSDIFFVAFKFPNLFRRIFAEGAFTQTFIPSFAKSKNKPLFSYLVLKKIFVIILILSIIVTIFSNFFTEIIAYGFNDYQKQLTAPLLAINFWYLDLIFLVTFLSSILQYKNHFATTAFSTALLNISLISALLISKDLSKYEIILNLSIAVIIGGVLQLLIHLYIANKYKILKMIYIGCKSKKKENIDNFNKNFLLSIFGNSTSQISSFIDTFLATFLAAGSISYLYYANRLFQLPFALFAIAISTVFFPKISKLISQNKEIDKIFKKIFWILLYLLTFSTIVAIIDSKEIVKLLFERGAFNSNDTINTANILTMYILGLIPYGIAKLFTSYLYAEDKSSLVAKFSTIAISINIILSIILINFLQAVGLALSSSIAGVVLLFLSIKEFGIYRFLNFFDIKNIIFLIILILFSIFFGIFIQNLLKEFLWQ